MAVPFLAFGGVSFRSPFVSFAAHSVRATVHSLTNSHQTYSVDGSKSDKGGSATAKIPPLPTVRTARQRTRATAASLHLPPPHCDKGQHLVGGKCKNDRGGNGNSEGDNGRYNGGTEKGGNRSGLSKRLPLQAW
jgi:hypothetical protein